MSQTAGGRSPCEDPVPAAVFPRGLHEPLDAVRVGARRQLARGREHEARAVADRVDTAADLGLDLAARRAFEDGYVHVADRDHTPLVAEGVEPVQLVHL